MPDSSTHLLPLNRYVVYLSLVVGGTALDLVTKSWAFARLGPPRHGNEWWVWTGVFGFETSLNPGALFGMGPGLWLVFALLAIIAVVVIVYWVFAKGAGRDWLLLIALGGITAGILGNLYDRLALHGIVWPGGELAGEPAHVVRDFILVMIGPFKWPNFNIADSLLVGGAGLMLWHAWFGQRPDEVSAETADAD